MLRFGHSLGIEAPTDAAGWKAQQAAQTKAHAALQADHDAALALFRAARMEQGLIG